jgi:hypothetical protein
MIGACRRRFNSLSVEAQLQLNREPLFRSRFQAAGLGRLYALSPR